MLRRKIFISNTEISYIISYVIIIIFSNAVSSHIKMRAELSPPVISISMKPHHLFRYPSEWDPRQNGKTKGGYLEGKIQLPKTSRNLRVLLSTHPEVKHKFPDVELSEADREIHPTLLHVVRKGRGNRLVLQKVPSEGS